MSPAGRELRAAFDAAVRAVRRDAALASAAVAALMLPAALVAGWVLADAGVWRAPSPWPLVLDLVALAAAAALGYRAWRSWGGEATVERVGADAERQGGLRAGTLRGILELGRGVPAGTSDALARQGEDRVWTSLRGLGARLAGDAGVRAGRRRRRALAAFGSAAALVALLGFAAPHRIRTGWTPLARPISTLAPPPLPALVVRPGDVQVQRGDAVPVDVQASGRTSVTLRWQSAGDVRRAAGLPVDSSGRGHGQLPAVDARTRYWIEAPDGAVSDTFTAVPRAALLVGRLAVDVEYPGYLGREAEHYENDVPPLDLPAGSRLVIRGRATRGLASVSLAADSGTGAVSFQVDGDGFLGRWTPRTTGVYAWRVRGADGIDAEIPPPALDLTIVADAPPQVDVTYPGRDTVLDPDLRQAVAAAASDDHGVREARLVSWRVGAMGHQDAPVAQALPPAGDAERVLLQGMLDANGRGMVPGDTLFYYVEVVDNSPAGQTGRSRTYRLRLPAMDEMRKAVESKLDEARKQAEAAADAAKRLEEQTRDLQRSGGVGRHPQQGGGSSPSGGDRKSLDYAQSQEAQQLLDRQEELRKQAEQLSQQNESLRQSMKNAGLEDAELQKRLSELGDLYKDLLSPEMQSQMDQLRKALAGMNPDEVNKALERLAAEQQEFREKLEQSLQLLRRAATEAKMNALSQSAKELATQQRSLADAMKDAASPGDHAAQQKSLSDRAEALKSDMKALKDRLDSQGEKRASGQTDQAASTVDEAHQKMQQAATAARAGQGQQAAESGEQAADQLESAAGSLQESRSQMAAQWRKEVQDAVDRATADALSLAERQDALVKQMKAAAGGRSAPTPKPPPEGAAAQPATASGGSPKPESGGSPKPESGASPKPASGGSPKPEAGAQSPPQRVDPEAIRSEQAAVEQGLEQLGRNLAETGRRSAMVSQDVTAALSRATSALKRTLRSMEESEGKLPVTEAGQSLDGLNRLALALLGNQQAIQKSQSGTGMQQALQQLSEMAKQQGSLNAESGSLLPLQLQAQAMRQSLQRIGKGQQGVADQLESLNKRLSDRGDVLGDLGGMQAEAEKLAQELGQGRLSPDVRRRQEQLFHRLLDAGRTLERDETSQERVAERPGDVAPLVPQALDPARVGDAVRFPVPDAERLRALPPAYRRLILEYFERLNRGEKPGGGTP